MGAPGGATRSRGRVRACSGTPPYDQPGATIQLPGLRHDRSAHKGERRAHKGERRAREGLDAGGVYRDTINCIVTGRRLGRWVVSRHRRDMVGGSTTIRRREL